MPDRSQAGIKPGPQEKAMSRKARTQGLGFLDAENLLMAHLACISLTGCLASNPGQTRVMHEDRRELKQPLTGTVHARPDIAGCSCGLGTSRRWSVATFGLHSGYG